MKKRILIGICAVLLLTSCAHEYNQVYKTTNNDYKYEFAKECFAKGKYGFAVEEISVQEVDEVSVSSTKIREALNKGDVTTAEHYLGTPYSLTGRVVHGLKLGRTLGYPTANIQVTEDYKLIPKDGVYAVYSYIDGRKVYGMMSIGKNPTIEGKGASIEVYFFDFNGNLYDQKLTIEFVQYLREEQKFATIDLLKKQFLLLV